MIYNDGYSTFAGGRHPRLFGSKVREGWPEVADFNDNIMKVGLAGKTLAYRDFPLILYRHDGKPEQVWLNLDYSPLLDEAGKPAGVMAIVVEITEKVRIERELNAERESLKRMFEQAPGFIAVVSGPQRRFTTVNEAYRDLVDHRDVLGKTVAEALPEVVGQTSLICSTASIASGEHHVGQSAFRSISSIAAAARSIDDISISSISRSLQRTAQPRASSSKGMTSPNSTRPSMLFAPSLTS